VVKAVWLLVVCAACSVARSADGAVISGPVTYPANGHVYYLLSLTTWTGAQAEALTLGGNLATVNDLPENGWIGDQFRAAAAAAGSELWGWIGLNDSDNDGAYSWVDGDPAPFRNWYQGVAPTLASDDYAAMLFTRSDQWNTHPNGSATFGQKVGIVEVLPEPAMASLVAALSFALVGRRRRLPGPPRRPCP
jgi:hypothetical protein